ncbi:hypothetical protein OM428_17570 [Enterococcus gallinarum]|nr:hypothetical protein [Enterococcus gallinarum]
MSDLTDEEISFYFYVCSNEYIFEEDLTEIHQDWFDNEQYSTEEIIIDKLSAYFDLALTSKEKIIYWSTYS